MTESMTTYLPLAVATVGLWLPILFRFYRSWSNRHNPISLAICAAILMLMWLAIAGIWLVSKTVDASLVMYISTWLSSLVAIYSHVAFYWAKKKFPERRS